VTAYIDSSALLKLYLAEPETDTAFDVMHRYPVWTTGRHTLVEVRRNLARLLVDRDLAVARRAFAEDWENVAVVELDGPTCEQAAKLAEQTGIKSLDALGTDDRFVTSSIPIAGSEAAGKGERTTYSAKRLVAPMTLVGLTALSVETRIIRSTENRFDIRATRHVPRMLFSAPSTGLSSTIGTCLCAAA